MKKKGYFRLFLCFVLVLSYCLPSFSKDLTIKDIENSEEFFRKKAEIRYTRVGEETIREVFVNGFKLNDENLAEMANDSEKINKINKEVTNRRFSWGAIVGVGIPLGSYLVYLAATRNKNNPVQLQGTQIIPNQSNGSDPQTFVLGTLGALTTLFGVINSVFLLNDLAGLSSPQVLKDNEVETLVKEYNEQLKQELLLKHKTSYNNNRPDNNDIFSNTVNIFSLNKSF